MALAPRIELRQSQSLVMTPQLQQAIKLLQMSNLELADYLRDRGREEPAARARAAGDRPRRAVGRRGDADAGFLEIDRRGGHASTITCATQIGTMRATPEVIEAALIVADEIEEDGYLRVPMAEVEAPAPADRRARRRPGCGWSRPAIRSASARAASPNAWRCSSASATGSTRRWRRCSRTCRWPRATSSPNCARSAASTPRISPTCSRSCARSIPKPGLRFAAAPDRGEGSRRARPARRRRHLDRRAEQRDPAAGAGQQHLRGHPPAATPAPAPSSPSAAPTPAGWCAASSSEPGRSSGWPARSSSVRNVSSLGGRRTSPTHATRRRRAASACTNQP